MSILKLKHPACHDGALASKQVMIPEIKSLYEPSTDSLLTTAPDIIDRTHTLVHFSQFK